MACTGGGACASTLHNCTVSGNWASHGGGGTSEHYWENSSSLYDCVVIGNSPYSVGAFFNCTVVGNEGGIWGTAFNSIVYYNSGFNYGEGTALNNCCTTPLPANGVGNITGPPLFMDMAAGDFRLWERSPCIDAGANLVGAAIVPFLYHDEANHSYTTILPPYSYEPTDIFGNTRFIDGNGDGGVAGISGHTSSTASSQILTVAEHQGYEGQTPVFASAPTVTNGLQLTITEPAAGTVYTLEASTNLVNWTKLAARTSSGNTFAYTDTRTATYPRRFYRVVVP